jgi:serine/threonine-protein kinase
MATDSSSTLVAALQQFQLLETEQLNALSGKLLSRFPEQKALAGELVKRGWLTVFQANQVLRGKGRELVLGQYVLPERLGEGAMGWVFKARHRRMGRTVALSSRPRRT